MGWEPGDRVRLPDGGTAAVLGVDDGGLVRVQLDGEATGSYPPEALRPVEEDD